MLDRAGERDVPAADRGATAVEYALLLMVIFLVIIGGVTYFGIRVDLMYSSAASAF